MVTCWKKPETSCRDPYFLKLQNPPHNQVFTVLSSSKFSDFLEVVTLCFFFFGATAVRHRAGAPTDWRFRHFARSLYTTLPVASNKAWCNFTSLLPARFWGLSGCKLLSLFPTRAHCHLSFKNHLRGICSLMRGTSWSNFMQTYFSQMCWVL